MLCLIRWLFLSWDYGIVGTGKTKCTYAGFDGCLVLSWEWMHKWHPVYPARVAELECFPWFQTRPRVTRLPKQGQPLDDTGRSVPDIAV